jgi:hypothetical protein
MFDKNPQQALLISLTVGCGAEGIRTPVQTNSNNFIGNIFVSIF